MSACAWCSELGDTCPRHEAMAEVAHYDALIEVPSPQREYDAADREANWDRWS